MTQQRKNIVTNPLQKIASRNMGKTWLAFGLFDEHRNTKVGTTKCLYNIFFLRYWNTFYFKDPKKVYNNISKNCV